jgi:hypothetical protein
VQNKAYYHRNPKKVIGSIKRSRAKRPDYYREQKRKNQVRRRDRWRQLVFDYYSGGTSDALVVVNENAISSQLITLVETEESKELHLSEPEPSAAPTSTGG